jgi:hypothetical protein
MLIDRRGMIRDRISGYTLSAKRLFAPGEKW